MIPQLPPDTRMDSSLSRWLEARRFDSRLRKIPVLRWARRNSWVASRFRRLVCIGPILMKTYLSVVFQKATTGNFRKSRNVKAVPLRRNGHDYQVNPGATEFLLLRDNLCSRSAPCDGSLDKVILAAKRARSESMHNKTS